MSRGSAFYDLIGFDWTPVVEPCYCKSSLKIVNKFCQVQGHFDVILFS